ncbi:hypothetical protein FJ364_00415 [Candidatus Dependentiae bacterium]|nr:hypothetical protein [Candidatus Dependentiae bacterium]
MLSNALMILLLIIGINPLFIHCFNKKATRSYDLSPVMHKTPQIVNTAMSANQQIASSSLNSSPSASTNGGQFVINKSGRYFLSTDIFAAPAASRVPCIYINTSDVTLDLGGKTLSLSPTTNQKNISAIEIAPNQNNITIMNGTLNGRAGTSSVYTTTGIMINTGTSDVTIDNVHVTNFGERAIVFDTNCSQILLNRVFAYNNGMISQFAARCISLMSCSDVTIVDSSFNKTNSTCLNSTYGVFAENCTNVTLKNVQISNTTATQGYLRGLWLHACNGALCDNVKILGSSAGNNAVSEVIGIDILGSSDCIFLNCKANNTQSSHYTTSAYGFKLANNANKNTFIDCEANNNQAGGSVAGFKLTNAHYNTFDQCFSIGNGGQARLAYGFQLGLNTRDGLSTDLILSCSGNSLRDCRAIGNKATNGDSFGMAISGETGSTIQNCEIRSNIASGKAYGIALHHTSIRNVIEFNKICTNTGTTGQYGIKDFASDSTTMLRGNVVFGHGATFAGGNATLIDSGTMNYFLKYAEATGQMNLQFIIKESDVANLNAFEAGSQWWFNYSILHNSIAG